MCRYGGGGEKQISSTKIPEFRKREENATENNDKSSKVKQTPPPLLLRFVLAFLFIEEVRDGRQKTDGRRSDFCAVPSFVFRSPLSDPFSAFGRIESDSFEELFREPKRIGLIGKENIMTFSDSKLTTPILWRPFERGIIMHTEAAAAAVAGASLLLVA